jgi:hypothetical protein
MVITYRSAEAAAKAAEVLGCRLLSNTGFHVYSNMQELIAGKVPDELCATFSKGRLPRTDDLLSRSVILTIGIGDNLLGASFGINPRSTDDEIKETAAEFHRRMASVGIA